MAGKKKGLYEEAVFEIETLNSLMVEKGKRELLESYDESFRDKITEKMNEEQVDEDLDEQLDLTELLSTVTEEEESEEVPTDAPSDVPTDAPTDEVPTDAISDEDANKAVTDMSVPELIAVIKDTVASALAGGEQAEQGLGLDDEGAEAGDAGLGDEAGMDTPLAGDEDVDLEELLNEVEQQINPTPTVQPVAVTQPISDVNQLKQENAQLRTQLQEALKANNAYKTAIRESKLYSEKSNKLARVLAKFTLNENQKRTIASRFDEAKDLKQVELIYNVLNESLGSKQKQTIQKPIASNIIGSNKTKLHESKGTPIIGNDLATRFKELAGMQPIK